jgi:hypothetical protein
MRRRRKIKVTKGSEARSDIRRIHGERTRRRGFWMSRLVVSVRVADVVWICWGSLRRRREVIMHRTKGISENKRRLLQLFRFHKDDDKTKTYPVDSPHVGSVSLSHMKLPTNAQTADMNSVAGTKTEVAIITGPTNIRSSNTW